MQVIEITPVRVQSTITTPFRVWALVTIAVLVVIIVINAD